jgi:hypothetical protein
MNKSREEIALSIIAIYCELEGLQTLLKITSDVIMKVDIRARIKWLEKMVDELYKNLEDMK